MQRHDFCAKGGSAQVLREHPQRLEKAMKRVGDGYVGSSQARSKTTPMNPI